MKKRILFVDDEPLMGDLFRLMFENMKDEWELYFASSGPEALGLLEKIPCEVVVSDMRMPGMDGAALLTQIREIAPTTIRMILSGFAEHAAIARAMPVAHVFFEKPCDLGELSRAIDRACAVRAVFDGEGLRAAVARLPTPLPAPLLYHELAALLVRADINNAAIAALVERDPDLRARVLADAQAQAAPGSAPVASVLDAATRLGAEAVIGLALAAHVSALPGGRPVPPALLVAQGAHALEVARAARKCVPLAVAADAHIAGLVHDFGKIVIASAFPDAHDAIERGLAVPGASRRQVELAALGTTHAELGAYLLALWGFPLPIVDAIARHDDREAPEGQMLDALRTAHAAVAIGR